jgi:hypothetical protein
MKVITLTADQKAALAPLKATLDAAAIPYQAAYAAYDAEVQVILAAADVTGRQPRVVLSDDGNSLIVGR